MLQIRLNKGSSLDSGIGAKSLPMETVTVTCPDHLVLADLPVAKGLGSATALSRVKIVGRRSRRQLGERVHFCVRCDFPIAIYGRLSPCEHVFCLDCARSDSICYLCDERIQKIQSVKLMEGIFICAAPHCLKSFLKKNDFEGHIHSNHGDLVQPKARKEEVHESDTGAKQFASADSLRVAPRPVLQPSSGSQLNDRDDKARRQLPREQTPLQTPMPTKPTSYYGQSSSHPSESQHDSRPPGFDGVTPLNHPHHQNFDTQGTTQQVILNEPRREYPQMFSHAPPNLPMPVNSNPPPFGFPPFPSEGLPPFYSVPIPYEVPRPELSTEGGAEQGPLLGYPPGSSGAVGYSEGYPRPWFGGPPNIHFEAMQGGQSTADGSVTSSDHQGRAGYYQGPPPGSNKVEQSQGVNVIDGEGVLVSQPMPPPPPPPGPPPPHLLQQKQGNYFFGDSNHDGKKYGSWQRDKRDSFGSNQDKL